MEFGMVSDDDLFHNTEHLLGIKHQGDQMFDCSEYRIDAFGFTML
jgi:hypothetical protein